uniref:Uncharacterized protein n=1 Tax=Oreochromis aureus TaxID=47969 RepID=A0AAZ1XE73_OREAU
ARPEVIREKGPARVQSRRQPPPTTSPAARFSTLGGGHRPRKPTPDDARGARDASPARRAQTALRAAERGGRRSDCSPARARAQPRRTPLPCSNMPEAVHLGDLLRIWVRSGVRLTPSPRIFKGQRELTDAARTATLPGHGPLSRANPFQGALPFTKKRELSRGPASFSGFAYVSQTGASPGRDAPPLRKCARRGGQPAAGRSREGSSHTAAAPPARRVESPGRLRDPTRLPLNGFTPC